MAIYHPLPSTCHYPVPPVTVVLVNYGGWQDTLACLKSLHQSNTPLLQVVVVDNASPNESLAQLKATQQRSQHYGPFHLIAAQHNTGFSGGNNTGIRWALQQPTPPSYVWLLNNDTTVNSATLPALLRQARQTGGIVGSVLRYPEGTFQQGGIKLNPWTGQLRGQPEATLKPGLPVAAVSGASMLIPTPVIRRVGLLPEAYFLYVEDVAYCLQAKQAGVSVTVCPNSVVWHEEGGSTGKLQTNNSGADSDAARHKPLNTQYYYQRNRLAVMLQYLPLPQKITCLLYTGFRWLRMALKAVLGGPLAAQRFASFTTAINHALAGRLGPI